MAAPLLRPQTQRGIKQGSETVEARAPAHRHASIWFQFELAFLVCIFEALSVSPLIMPPLGKGLACSRATLGPDLEPHPQGSDCPKGLQKRMPRPCRIGQALYEPQMQDVPYLYNSACLNTSRLNFHSRDAAQKSQNKAPKERHGALRSHSGQLRKEGARVCVWNAHERPYSSQNRVYR